MHVNLISPGLGLDFAKTEVNEVGARYYFSCETLKSQTEVVAISRQEHNLRELQHNSRVCEWCIQNGHIQNSL